MTFYLVDRTAAPGFQAPRREGASALRLPGVVETMERRMALLKLFPGAVYSHGAQSFLIEELDAKARIAWAVPRDPRTLDFYTEVRDHTRVKV